MPSTGAAKSGGLSVDNLSSPPGYGRRSSSTSASLLVRNVVLFGPVQIASRAFTRDGRSRVLGPFSTGGLRLWSVLQLLVRRRTRTIWFSLRRQFLDVRTLSNHPIGDRGCCMRLVGPKQKKAVACADGVHGSSQPILYVQFVALWILTKLDVTDEFGRSSDYNQIPSFPGHHDVCGFSTRRFSSAGRLTITGLC